MIKKRQEDIKNQDVVEMQSDTAGTIDTDFAQSSGGIVEVAALSSEKRPPLVRRDLLKYEDVLCRDLSLFVKFEGHALYFPTQDELPSVQYLEDEKKLLVPLRRDNALLGIMLLRHVCLEGHVISFLPALIQICLDKIYYIKLSGLDEQCNLMRSEQFMMRVHKEIHGIRQFYAQSFAGSLMANGDNKKSIATESTSILDGLPTNIYSEYTECVREGQIDRQSSVGLMVLPVLGLDYIRKFYGFTIAEQLFVSISQKIKDALPEDALCTMLDNDTFAVLFLGATKRMMENLAGQCVVIEESIQAIPVTSMLTIMENLESVVEVKLCAGYALFPQDWDGMTGSRYHAEIPHLLLQKASIAANRLKNMPNKKGVLPENETFHVAGSVLSFRQILLQGGNITEMLPYSQVRVNLGSDNGAQESMCFSVWGDAERIRYKGEILLNRVSEKTSEAEILMLSDPAKNLEEGDFLQYAPQSRSQSEILNDEGTLFYAYRDFMSVVNGQISADKMKKFSLALLRIQWEKQSHTHSKIINFDDHSLSSAHATSNTKKEVEKETKAGGNARENTRENARQEFTMKDIAQELDIYLKEYNEVNNSEMLTPVIGSMSFNSVIIYHPQMGEESLKALYEEIAFMLEKKFDVPCSIGIASYPFLNFRPADMWDTCRKALDYAMLLPAPHVGVFNSLAMNISADRKFSQGDIFGAVEEYRMALFADADNILAWNSLGICLASLGRYAEARNAFEVAYACEKQDPATCYNLGTANLALDDRETAKEYFLACLSQEKDHLFARIRLGEIAEKELMFDDALEQYTQASIDNPKNSVPFRCLARLYILNGQKERARELLQLALQKNAEDAVSLQLLAGLYLDGGEDAHLAEVLARQSVALLPWRRTAWAELARALEAQGRFPEAAEVRRNSMRL